MSWYGSDASMQDFEDRHGLTFKSLRDDDGSLFAHFGVVNQPAWVFVSADGTPDLVPGAMEEDELAEITQKAIRLRKILLKENDRKRAERAARGGQ